MKHFIIPDTQVKPGVETIHFDWCAKEIIAQKPDLIIHLGDHWDFPSLNGHADAEEIEGQRLIEDISAGYVALKGLTDKIRAAKKKDRRWKPKLHFLTGNHEHRLMRFIGSHPILKGSITPEALGVEQLGWIKHPFLEIFEADGVAYSHYFINTLSGKPVGGSIPSRLGKIGRSFVQGHQQGFLYGCQQYPGNLMRHGIVAGSFYLHDEKYRGLQGNDEWRGVVVLNEVREGNFDISPISMETLRKKYSKK